MANESQRPQRPDNGNQRRFQQPRRGFNWFSLVYLILLLGFAYMWLNSGTADPLKKEWLEVKETILTSGDVEKLVYVRNERKDQLDVRYCF